VEATPPQSTQIDITHRSCLPTHFSSLETGSPSVASKKTTSCLAKSMRFCVQTRKVVRIVVLFQALLYRRREVLAVQQDSPRLQGCRQDMF
ncbi:hypothetical protein F443_13080, partial [Phytophthora nicotianae P1569]